MCQPLHLRRKAKNNRKFFLEFCPLHLRTLQENPHGQRSLAGYNSWGCRVRHNWATKHSTGVTKSFISSQLAVNQRQIKALNCSSWEWTVLKDLGESGQEGLWYAKKAVKLSWMLCKSTYFCYAKFPLEVSVQFSHSVVSDSVTRWTATRQANLSITNSRRLLKLMFIELAMAANYLILCCPLLPPSIFPSLRVFSNVSSSHQVARVLEFQLQHQSFQWIFRTDFL